MDVRVRERLVGALVLVAIVVLFVPAILKGRGSGLAEPPGDVPRRVEVPTYNAPPAPDEQVLVPEPVPEAAPPAETKAKEATQPAPQASDLRARPAEPNSGPPSARAATVPEPVSTSQDAALPAAKPPAAKVESSATAWAVQLGAFSNRVKAEQLVAELKQRRYAAFILEYRASGQVLYRVRVGPEQDRGRAEEIAARLAKDGFQPVVARHP